MKKIAYVMFFLSTAVATSGFFIPLAKDGSVRWSTQEQTSANYVEADPKDLNLEDEERNTDKTRKPAGSDSETYTRPSKDSAYEPPPRNNYRPSKDSDYTPPSGGGNYPPPRYPTLGIYSCIRQGLLNAGYVNPSDKYIAMFAVRAKNNADSAWFGGKTETRNRRATSQTALAISSVGYCTNKNYPMTSQDARQVSQWLNTEDLEEVDGQAYEQTFGISEKKVMPNGFVNKWSNMSTESKRKYWLKNNAYTEAGRCAKDYPSARKRIFVCENIYRACQLNNISECKSKPAYRDVGGRSSGGGGGGNTMGGHTNGGHNNGGHNSGGARETPSGNNNDAGHGNNTSGNQGSGPPGSAQ